MVDTGTPSLAITTVGTASLSNNVIANGTAGFIPSATNGTLNNGQGAELTCGGGGAGGTAFINAASTWVRQFPTSGSNGGIRIVWPGDTRLFPGQDVGSTSRGFIPPQDSAIISNINIVVQYLAVGGGGAGGVSEITGAGGGGGAGGYTTGSFTFVKGLVYDISVGAGGNAYVIDSYTGLLGNGGRSTITGSSITTIIVYGGGAGGYSITGGLFTESGVQ
jgi:hypothetical protein